MGFLQHFFSRPKLISPGRTKLDIDIELVRMMKLHGLSTREIAKRLHCSESTIRRRIIANQELVAPASHGRPKIPVSNDAIIELKKKGCSNRAIARDLGCSEATIRRRLSECVNNASKSEF